jgi:hypothetical protein
MAIDSQIVQQPAETEQKIGAGFVDSRSRYRDAGLGRESGYALPRSVRGYLRGSYDVRRVRMGPLFNGPSIFAPDVLGAS